MISPKVVPSCPYTGLNFGLIKTPAMGETVTDSLCHGYHIGTDTRMLMGKEFTASSVTRLDFIQHKHRVCRFTCLAQVLQKIQHRVSEYLQPPEFLQ